MVAIALSGLIIGGGLFFLYMLRAHTYLGDDPAACVNCHIMGPYYATCICAALVTTVGNTLVNWLDSVLYGYYSFAYVFGDFVYRAGVGVLNAAAMATIFS